jgi:hypothetical protein
MPNNLSKEVIGLFPRLNGLVDPAVDRELFLAFLRLYEYFSNTIETKVIEVKKASTVESQQLTEKTTQLINNFAAKLIKGNNGNGNNPLETLGSGTVTSVAASGNSIFSVGGSPIVETGTFTFILISQAANKIFAGPVSGGSVVPTFRLLVKEDINFPYKLTTSTNADPTTTEYINGTWGIHKNSISGDVFIVYNDGGVIKKLTLV